MIGKLDRRVTIIEPVKSTGTSNEDKITAWTALDTVPEVWASLAVSRGSVSVDADRVVYSQISNWVIRFRTGLNIEMRLVDGNGKVYQILSIAEINERKRYLNLTTNLIDNEYWS